MWPQIAYAIVMMIVSAAISLAMQKPPIRPKAGELDVPSAEEGSNIPVVFGTVIVKNVNVIWYGNPAQKPIYTKGGKK